MTVSQEPPYPTELVYGHEAAAETGVPEQVIRSWASRGRVRRYPGDGRPSGQGHGYRTMYALPDVRAAAATYRPRVRAA
ncbi:hypothetical protein RM844_30285 [Streptomyces sp. DSM 44915]|uniref:MerR family transcriptional regulator n=1 Tax=Streptomyces chisholmiae TaxID=3075540 RepID=A0ABU2JZZ6_9ACTN|nr:hypothetical protein [Streptomyces sp. DSM 44915]MDT0270570.1 hypothetical protein [Streptomyces sp. DSM 44915]